MIYQRSARFKAAANKLPAEIQAKVRKAFNLFRDNPHHPSLGIKKVKGLEGVWEGRIDVFYRFTFEYIDNPNFNEETDDEGNKTVCLFRNIGRHEIVSESP